MSTPLDPSTPVTNPDLLEATVTVSPADAKNNISNEDDATNTDKPKNMNNTSGDGDGDGDGQLEPELELDDDVLNDMDDSQLEEYQQILRCLGTHPDKVLINTLTMIAEDYASSNANGENPKDSDTSINNITPYTKSCASIYDSIKDLLLSSDISAECKLPLVYVMDSILKNVRGYFLQLMQEDFFPKNEGEAIPIDVDKKNWMTAVYDALSQHDDQHDHPHTVARSRLRRVWNTWNQPPSFQLFPVSQWKAIGQCFVEEDERIQQSKLKADAMTRAAGIERNERDGSLKLSMALRKQMEIVLDELQDNQVSELEKVSLERLADIDPNLLVEIKKAAEAALLEKKSSSHGGHGMNTASTHDYHVTGQGQGDILTEGHENDENSLFVEMRSKDVIQRCRDWDTLQLNHLEGANETIRKLFGHIRTGTSSSINTVTGTGTEEGEVDMIKLLGTASAAASTLTNLLERYKQQDANKGSIAFTAVPGGDSSSSLFHSNTPSYGNTMISQRVDPSKFTTEGLKEKNNAVIARLYEGGLPFVCSSDGRRFATQVELSNHLDELFKRAQLEKSMERNEERGWYSSDDEWSRRKSGVEGAGGMNGEVDADIYMDVDEDMLASSADHNDNNKDPQTIMVTADESRDRCAICGINFAMHFDQEEGEWKYKNCREVKVLNDDAAERDSELALVHVTCHRGLGSPGVLSQDQVLKMMQFDPMQ